MQIRLELTADMLDLPIAYNTIVQGFIYAALKKGDNEYSENLHERGKELGKNLVKLFSFGRLLGDHYIKGREIVFPKKASLEIRSPDGGFISAFMNGCPAGEYITLGTNRVKVDSCRIYDRHMMPPSITARSISPFCYKMDEAPADRVFVPETARYKLTENALKKWVTAGNDPAGFEFDVSFPERPPRAVNCIFKGTFITAWEGDFTVYGNAKTLDFIYDVGIGARNSQGFGMFEVV